jgi:hypothetical protein
MNKMAKVDLSKLAMQMRTVAESEGPNKVIENKEPLSFNEASKLENDYFFNFPGFIGKCALNEDVPEELSSYVVCLRGCKYNA